MSKLTERLDALRELVQSQGFLNGDGLSNEVNIRIFCYEAEDEMIVQHFLQQLVSDPDLGCHLIECNLYRIFLDICEEMGVQDEIPEMEDEEGSDFLLEQLQAFATPDAFVEKMQYSQHRPGDVLLLTGVGDVFPFMRIHALLEALQPHFTGIPIIVLYPGEYDGHHVRLFGKLPPNDYYRAFSIV